jgi:transposase-like protein
MRGPYAGELRRRVIGFVEAGGSRREAAEQFDIGVSSPIRWMPRFREDGTCEPMPRSGSTSPLEEYTQQILALNREKPDLTLNERAHGFRLINGRSFNGLEGRAPDVERGTAWPRRVGLLRVKADQCSCYRCCRV